LQTGRISPQGQVMVQAKANEPDPAFRRTIYTWTGRISVPGGGLVERDGQFDFMAPEEGYREADELGMDSKAERWTSQVEKEYFLRLADGRYARIHIVLSAGGNHFFNLAFHLNPTPGHRNLAYDPAKRVRP
jgi:hypothetical protein